MIERDMYFADEKARKRYQITNIITKILLYTFLTIMAIFMLIPFYWMINTSLKSRAIMLEENSRGMPYFFAPNPTLDNFKIILIGSSGRSSEFLQYFLNTLIVGICSTIITVVTTVLAAFAFARLEFKFKEPIFMVLLATMMIPGEMMVITNFQTIMALNWDNKYVALILTHAISVFYIFYMRQTFQQIPNELYLAAKVDGYGVFKYLWKVMIPIAMPTIVTIIILSVMGSWNAYIWPNLVASGTHPWFGNSMKLVSNGLMATFSSEFSSQDEVMLAGSFVVTLPLFIFFLCFRKYIMRGVSRSGIKG